MIIGAEKLGKSFFFFIPEQHKNGCWHQKDLIAGDELQDILLIGGKFIQEVSDEHQTVGSQRLRRNPSV